MEDLTSSDVVIVEPSTSVDSVVVLTPAVEQVTPQQQQSEISKASEPGPAALPRPADAEPRREGNSEVQIVTLESLKRATTPPEVGPSKRLRGQNSIITLSDTSTSTGSSPVAPASGSVAPSQFEGKRAAAVLRRDAHLAAAALLKRDMETSERAKELEKQRAEKQQFGEDAMRQFGIQSKPIVAIPGQAAVVREHSSEQRQVLEAVLGGKNVFFTGSAGVGKSFLLAEITAALKTRGLRYHVCATTGIAAVNIKGITVHGWAGLGLLKKSIGELFLQLESARLSKQRWLTTDVLIIDEVSMLDADFFLKLNLLAKLIRRNVQPFGGIQVILCGDFFQLPPVPDSAPQCIRCGTPSKNAIRLTAQEAQVSYLPRPARLAEFKMIECRKCQLHTRDRTFIFETETWSECDFQVMELTKVFRQADVEFIALLEQMRRGHCTQEHANILKTYGSALGEMQAIKPTNIYPKNIAVDTMNATEFKRLKQTAYIFKAVDDEGMVKSSVAQARLKELSCPVKLALKTGCQVILTANLDTPGGFVNGSRGVIVGWKAASDVANSAPPAGSLAPIFTKAHNKPHNKPNHSSDEDDMFSFWREQEHDLFPEVYFANGQTSVIKPWAWKIEVEKNKSISRMQIPLILGWALTVHKSQGQSLDAAAVRLEDTFEYGQAYVALSRCKTPQGLKVSGMDPKLVKANPSVLAFYDLIKLNKTYYDTPPLFVNPYTYLDQIHIDTFRDLRRFLPSAPQPIPPGSSLIRPLTPAVIAPPVQHTADNITVPRRPHEPEWRALLRAAIVYRKVDGLSGQAEVAEFIEIARKLIDGPLQGGDETQKKLMDALETRIREEQSREDTAVCALEEAQVEEEEAVEETEDEGVKEEMRRMKPGE